MPRCLRLALLVTFTAALSACFSETSEPQKGLETIEQSVVYGEESRTDYYASDNEILRRITREAIAAPIGASSIDDTDPDNIIISGGNYGERYNLCESEPFRDQLTAAGCSATLIDDDLLLTAGHCVDERLDDCTMMRYVFDFYYAAEGVLETISTDDVYACLDIVSFGLGGADDYAIVQLDRPVVGRVPVPVTTSEEALAVDTPVWMIGFGNGLPAKLDDDGFVTNSGDVDYPRRFNATVDAFGGNSGSGVFSEEGIVVGILVAGQRDYSDTEDGCSIVNVIADDAGIGESIVYARRAVERLCANGHPSERLCPSGGVGLCGECASQDDCLPGFVCTADPLSAVNRCTVECASDDDCRSDHVCEVDTCLPRWTTECRAGDAAYISPCGEEGPVAEDCSELQYCDDGACSDRVDGDVCSSAIEIPAVSATITGDLGDGARSDYESGDCGGSGRELVYHFTLEDEQFVWAEVTGFDTVLYLRSDACADGELAACNDDFPGVPDEGSQIGVVLPAGDYYMFVDTDGDRDEFELDFRVLRPCEATCFVGTTECAPDAELVRTCVEGADACPEWEEVLVCGATELCFEEECGPRVEGDVCANALSLEPVSQTLAGELTGPTRADYRGSCAGNGRELVYEMEVTEPIRWRATSTGFDTVLHVRRDACESLDAQTACNDDNDTVEDRGSLLNVVLDPDTYYVFVDAYGTGTTGEFEVEIEVECGYECEAGAARCADGSVSVCVVPDEGCPYWEVESVCSESATCVEDACVERPAGDWCASAESIVGESQTLTGDMSAGFLADYRGTCAGGGPDRVYTFELEERSDLTFSATGYDTVLHVRSSSCVDSAAEAGCNDDGGDLPGYGSFLEVTLEPGTHFLFVDAYNNSVGEFELEMVVEAAVEPGDVGVGVDVGTDVPEDVEDTGVDPIDDVPDTGDDVPDAGEDADAEVDAPDAPADTPEDAETDVGSDVLEDAADVSPDTDDDADVGTDATEDTSSDVGTDAVEDTGADAIEDTAVDVVDDAEADAGSDTAPDTEQDVMEDSADDAAEADVEDTSEADASEDVAEVGQADAPEGDAGEVGPGDSGGDGGEVVVVPSGEEEPKSGCSSSNQAPNSSWLALALASIALRRRKQEC